MHIKTNIYKNRKTTTVEGTESLAGRKIRDRNSVSKHNRISLLRSSLSDANGLSISELLSISSALDAKIKGEINVNGPITLSAKRQLSKILRECGTDKQKLIREQNIVNCVIMKKNSIENQPSEVNRERYLKILKGIDF